MTNERFNLEYSEVINRSSDFTDLDCIAQFIHELIHCSIDDWNITLQQIRIIEDDLLSRNILPFRIEFYEDINRINSNSIEGEIQLYIWIFLYKVKGEH